MSYSPYLPLPNALPLHFIVPMLVQHSHLGSFRTHSRAGVRYFPSRFDLMTYAVAI